MRGKSESEVAGSKERLTSALMVIGFRLPRPRSSQVCSFLNLRTGARGSARGLAQRRNTSMNTDWIKFCELCTISYPSFRLAANNLGRAYHWQAILYRLLA